MAEDVAICEEKYRLSERIFKNTFINVWEELLKNKGLDREYKEYKNGYLQFINSSLEDGKLNIDDINETLVSGLLFGRQRDIQIYKIEPIKLYTKEELLSLLNENYGIDTIPYNNLAHTYSNSNIELEFIGYVDIKVDESTKLITKLDMIFAKQIMYTGKYDTTNIESSYFPISIDFANKKMIVKYYDKNYLKGDSRGEDLANKYSANIMRLLRIEIGSSNQAKYQRGLYNICNHILNSVINEKSNLIIEGIEEIVEEYSKSIGDRLLPNVDVNHLLSEHKKDVFDIRKQINKMIENICISKIIYEAKSNGLMSVDGLISYITYREVGNVKATLKKPTKLQNLLDSQSYLNLRSVLDETKYIEEIKIIWNWEGKQISLRYDASKKEYIAIKFYKKFKSEDLEYAIRRWEEFC